MNLMGIFLELLNLYSWDSYIKFLYEVDDLSRSVFIALIARTTKWSYSKHSLRRTFTTCIVMDRSSCVTIFLDLCRRRSLASRKDLRPSKFKYRYRKISLLDHIGKLWKA